MGIEVLSAKEFLDSEQFMREEWNCPAVHSYMIEFAKAHVKAALEVAANNSLKMSSTPDTIKACYPEENIK